ncbi:MAG: diguanylate cyclase [Myxococcaceae bacterium]
MEQPEAHSKILVVDDDPAIREALVGLLEPRYQVKSARDGVEALEVARAWRPELVLMDVNMPSSDGLAARNELLRDPRTERIPVIFVSAPGDDLPARCLAAGAADYLAKPVDGRELVARIDRALRESRERRALEELAQTDALTGLANYRALAGRIEHEFHRASRYGYPVSVVSIDLDHLKEINDRFGHELGNRAIIALAHYLRSSLREADFAARYGGDEFVVILPHQAPHEAAVFAERLRQGLRILRVAGEDPRLADLELSVSVGIAGDFGEARKESADALLEASDLALYEAKRRGRNQVVVYEQILERRRLEAHREQ